MIEIEEKAKELSVEYKCEVTPIVFKDADTTESVIGYVKEPTRMVKLRMLDKAAVGGFTAAGEVFEACLLKEESDPRFSSEKSEDDKIYFGGVLEMYNKVQFSVNQFKKK